MTQTRVIHLVVHGRILEVYVNLMLPGGEKSLMWGKLFDHDRDGRLNAKELQRLGQHLSSYAGRGLVGHFQGKTIPLRLLEVQSSRLRGSPQQGRYSWDYRYQGDLPERGEGEYLLGIALQPLWKDERIPVALTTLAPDTLKDSFGSYVFPDRRRATCQAYAARPSCSFVLLARRLSPKKKVH